MAAIKQPPVNQLSKGAVSFKWACVDPEHDVWLLGTTGAPTSGAGGTASYTGKGSLLIDVQNGEAYINQGVVGTPQWKKITHA